MDGGRLLKDFLFLRMRNNRILAKKISGSVSLIFSLGLLTLSIVFFAPITILFSLLFIYFSLVELELIKK